MTKPNDAGEMLGAILNALADQVGSASDREILESEAARGTDVKKEADRVRGILLNAVLRAKKERLHRAAQAHQRAVEHLTSRQSHLPRDAAARRALLSRSLQRRPQMREAIMTLQHREFDSFSDADVESALRQMDALGLLDDDQESKP